MSDELARVLLELLRTTEAYDKEQPVQTRLATKHALMRAAMSTARVALEAYRNPRVLCLDGEAAPEYSASQTTTTADWPEESVRL